MRVACDESASCAACEFHGRCAREPEWVECGCCGILVRNNTKENAHFGMVPYPDDNGYGECRSCGGDPALFDTVDLADEQAVRKAFGWAKCMLIDSRVDTLMKGLNEKNREKLAKMTFAQKADVVISLMEEGAII